MHRAWTCDCGYVGFATPVCPGGRHSYAAVLAQRDLRAVGLTEYRLDAWRQAA